MDTTLEGLMRKAGEMGMSIVVRYDRWRDSHNFTLIDGRGSRIADTDDPVHTLQQYLATKEK